MSDLWSEKLEWFKKHETPRPLILLAENPVRAEVAIAWTHTRVRRKEATSPLDAQLPNFIWEWLWLNIELTLDDLAGRTSMAYRDVQTHFLVLAGNRVLYPDGDLNSWVRRYLNNSALRLLASPAPRTARRKRA